MGAWYHGGLVRARGRQCRRRYLHARSSHILKSTFNLPSCWFILRLIQYSPLPIDVVWFPEGPGGDNFTEKIFRGPIHHMTREALDYIRRNYLNKTIIKHRDRAEATHVENFPYVAIEETLINAIYHRGYQEREPVEGGGADWGR
jgi:hypothetical protein